MIKGAAMMGLFALLLFATRLQWSASNTAAPSGPETTASPSKLNDLPRS
jgi:hypothetical protein